MTDTTYRYEDVVAGHMQEFTVKETQAAYIVTVPGLSPQDATADQPATAGTPSKTWSFPKEALSRVFGHGREDLPALCDFIQASWTFAHAPDQRGDTILKPTEEAMKLTAVCKKFAKSLLDALDINSYVQFRELNICIDLHTTTGTQRAAEAQAIKDAKKAERDAKTADARAEKKAIKDKERAEKKAVKDKEKAEKKAAKDAEKAEKKEAEKKKIEAARIESVANKKAADEKAGAKKYTGKENKKTLTKADKAELKRVEAEEKAAKAAKAADVEKQDGEWNSSTPDSNDAVTDAILNGDDTQQG